MEQSKTDTHHLCVKVPFVFVKYCGKVKGNWIV